MRDADSFDTDLYRAPRTLWVEDDLTRHFLTKFWGDLDIAIRTAGGREGVACMVRGAPVGRAGRSIVGLVDRDFDGENRAEWARPEVPTLRTARHEFENYLLDFEALAQLSRATSPSEVESMARDFAAQLVWWMACKEMRDELHRAFTAGFPRDPAVPPAQQAPCDVETATQHLLTSNFWRAREHLLRHRYSEKDVRRRLGELGNRYEEELQKGSWQESFSGKEILRHLRSHVPNLDKAIGGSTSSSSQRDEDLAKRLSPIMRASASPDHDLKELHRALRKRAGLS